MDESGRDRREDVEQEAREPAPDAARLDQGRGEEDDERLDEDVAPSHVSELVRDRRLELLRAQRLQRPRGDSDRRARRPAADDEQPREPVGDDVQLRRADGELGGDGVGSRAQQRVLGERERPGAEHPEQCAVAVAVHTHRREKRAEAEEERGRPAADEPTEPTEQSCEKRDEEERLRRD